MGRVWVGIAAPFVSSEGRLEATLEARIAVHAAVVSAAALIAVSVLTLPIAAGASAAAGTVVLHGVASGLGALWSRVWPMTVAGNVSAIVTGVLATSLLDAADALIVASAACSIGAWQLLGGGVSTPEAIAIFLPHAGLLIANAARDPSDSPPSRNALIALAVSAVVTLGIGVFATLTRQSMRRSQDWIHEQVSRARDLLQEEDYDGALDAMEDLEDAPLRTAEIALWTAIEAAHEMHVRSRAQGRKHRSRSFTVNASQARRLSGSLGALTPGGPSASTPSAMPQALSPQKRRLQRDRKFLVLFKMPQLGDYAFTTGMEAGMLQRLLSDFDGHVSRASSVYGGESLSHTFSERIVAFDSCADAIGGAYYAMRESKRVASHYKETLVARLKPHALLAVVAQSETCLWPTGESAAHHVGAATAEDFFKGVHALPTNITQPPSVVVTESLGPLLDGDFTLAAAWPGCRRLVEPLAHLPDGRAAVSSTQQREGRAAPGTEYPLPQATEEFSSRFGASSASAEDETLRRYSANVVVGAGRRSTVNNVRRRLGSEVVEIWDKYDKDRNGHLDPDEVHDLLDDLNIVLTNDEFNEFFVQLDKDGSNTISLQEFAEGFYSSILSAAKAVSVIRRRAQELASQGEDVPGRIAVAFSRVDSQGLGSLGVEGVRTTLQSLGVELDAAECQWLVKKIDYNGDGAVDFEDFAELFDLEDAAPSKKQRARQRCQQIARVMDSVETRVVAANERQLAEARMIRVQLWLETWGSWLILAYIAYVCGLGPYRAALGESWYPVPTREIVLDHVLDAVFLGWFALRIFVMPLNIRGQQEHGRVAVLKAHAKTFTFWSNLVAIVPLTIAFWASGSGDYAWYRINKLAVFAQLNDRFFAALRWLSPTMVRVLNSALWFLALSHLVGCVLLYIAVREGENALSDLIGRDDLLTAHDTRYLSALRWGLKSLAGQIRGAAVPDDDLNVAFMTCVILIGLPLYAGLLGVIGNAYNGLSAIERLMSTIDTVRGYFSYWESAAGVDSKMSRELANEAVAYYRHVFATTGSLDITANPLDDVPIELSIQVTVETGLSMLRKVAIFESACENVEFVHEITTKMMPRVVEPGTVVMRKGERGTDMYFVTVGEFHVVVENAGVVFTMRKGNFFGEIALLHDVKRTATIVCDEHRYANALTLEKRDFDEVLQMFPQCLSVISLAAADRLKTILEQEAEEQRRAAEARTEGLAQYRTKRMNGAASGDVSQFFSTSTAAGLIDGSVRRSSSAAGRQKSTLVPGLVMSSKSSRVGGSSGLEDALGGDEEEPRGDAPFSNPFADPSSND